MAPYFSIEKGEISQAHYTIWACGLESDTVKGVFIDRRIELVQPHPETRLYLCPITPNPQPNLIEAWFYCNCISYEHEIPAIVESTEADVEEFCHVYAHNGPSKAKEYFVECLGEESKTERGVDLPIPPKDISKHFLMGQILRIYDETREMRHGPLTAISFRTSHNRRLSYIDYTSLYGSVSKEIALYAAALRQADFLSEYLGYYRVVESVSKSYGKQWIKNALPRLRHHSFPKVMINHSACFDEPPRNLIGIYKRRASSRLRQLRKKYSTDDKIASYLYNTVRCGIAHGKEQVVFGDILPSYFEIAQDAIIIKLLARMAIDEKRTALAAKCP